MQNMSLIFAHHSIRKEPVLHCVTPRYVAGDGDLVWVRAQLESGELGLHTRHPGGHNNMPP